MNFWHGQSVVVTCYTAGVYVEWHLMVIITFTFCCDNPWKSKFVALEKPGKLREFFSPTLWHPDWCTPFHHWCAVAHGATSIGTLSQNATLLLRSYLNSVRNGMILITFCTQNPEEIWRERLCICPLHLKMKNGITLPCKMQDLSIWSKLYHFPPNQTAFKTAGYVN